MNAREPDRLKLVQNLLSFSMPLHETMTQLAAMGWDYEGMPVTLTGAHLDSVLRRYLAGQLSAADVGNWANLIEGRDDIVFEPGCADRIDDMVYELANPILTQPLDASTASTLLAGLANNSSC